jgi:hypothetical protein
VAPDANPAEITTTGGPASEARAGKYGRGPLRFVPMPSGLDN